MTWAKLHGLELLKYVCFTTATEAIELCKCLSSYSTDVMVLTT